MCNTRNYLQYPIHINLSPFCVNHHLQICDILYHCLRMVCMFLLHILTHSFGSLVCSRTSGVIFNNEMKDFDSPTQTSSPLSGSNYIEPGKRPLSSTTPTVILDGEKVKMVVGAAGGIYQNHHCHCTGQHYM